MPGPGGVCAWSRGSGPGVGGLVLGGAWSRGGEGGWRPHPGRPLLRAVRILLECILVDNGFRDMTLVLDPGDAEKLGDVILISIVK